MFEKIFDISYLNLMVGGGELGVGSRLTQLTDGVCDPRKSRGRVGGGVQAGLESEQGPRSQ